MGQTHEAQAKANRRKKTVLEHVKQEHIGDFGVGIGDSASWRSDDPMNDGWAGYTL